MGHRYSKIIEEALSAARKAVRRRRLEGHREPLGRGAGGDITHRIDLVAESVILGVLRRGLPDATILSEESGLIGAREVKRGLVVLVDPIDGTSNSIRGLGFYSSAITIAEGATFSQIKAAGVMDLVRGQLIIGERGRGVRFNGKEARPSQETDLDRAHVALDAKLRDLSEEMEKGVARVLKEVRHPRSLGSSALETALVAVGILDAFLEPAPRLRSIDSLGAIFLVKEAGGYARLFEGPLEEAPLLVFNRFAYLVAGNWGLGRRLEGLLGFG